jgi:NTP pyrophosphatase (non-canonical NTP hydrolase)
MGAQDARRADRGDPREQRGEGIPAGGGGPGTNSWGDYVALLHSEISEALEAYRDHRLEDATVGGSGYVGAGQAFKPEGVGSEFADLLIRLLDMADVFGIDLEREYVRKLAYNRTRSFQHGGRALAEPDDVPTGRRAVVDVIREAIPDDPRDWWAGHEVDEFLDQWARLGLPKMLLQDATGEVLTLWVDDADRAAEMLGETAGSYEGIGFEMTKGAYTVLVLVIDKESVS